MFVCLLLGGVLRYGADAHTGYTVVPVYEVPTSDIPVLDGEIDEWEDIVPQASLTTLDFTDLSGGLPDPTDFATRVFLAWNGATQRLYIAIERIDDIYTNALDDDNDDFPFFPRSDFVSVFVDGDHSGGLHECFEDVASARALTGSQAQRYNAIAEWPAGLPLRYSEGPVPLPGPGNTWVPHPPYADLAASQAGDEPNRSVLELYLTPWDRIDKAGPEQSLASRLEAGPIIGMFFLIADADFDAEGLYRINAIRTGASVSCDASAFVDAELIPCHRGDCGSAPPAVSAVGADSWARIKAAFGLRP